VQLASALSHTDGPAPPIDTDAAKAARFLAVRVEAGVTRLLSRRVVYQVIQAGWKAWRLVRGR
jgi:hypothetical protein